MRCEIEGVTTHPNLMPPRIDVRPKDAERMAELDRKLKAEAAGRLYRRIYLHHPEVFGPDHPTGKRAAWLHFCRRCGVDLSLAPRGVRLCQA